MIRGHCIGGGGELATRCDLRFTDPTGVFRGDPGQGRRRLHAGVDQGALLDLVGPSLTQSLLDSGELIDAATALRTGLVDFLVEPAELEPRVVGCAEVLAARWALSQRATKQVLAALTAGRDGRAEASRWYRETIAAGELAEGVAAFAERRPPRSPWNGG